MKIVCSLFICMILSSLNLHAGDGITGDPYVRHFEYKSLSPLQKKLFDDFVEDEFPQGSALWRELSSSPELKEMSKILERELWLDVASFYNANLQNICGPYLRSYGMDMKKYTAITGVWIAAAIDNPAIANVPGRSGPHADPKAENFEILVYSKNATPKNFKDDLWSLLPMNMQIKTELKRAGTSVLTAEECRDVIESDTYYPYLIKVVYKTPSNWNPTDPMVIITPKY